MKKMYWRPRRVSRTVLLLISIMAIVGYISIGLLKTDVRQPYYEQKLAAARVAEKAFKAIRTERLKRGLKIDVESDPAQTGIIGALMTVATTNQGSLSSKQTSVNPNFAAVIVHLLRKAGVRPDDAVAVGYSGSFPAVNVNVLAALEVMKVKPVIVASAGASQWGANEPEFLWLDMEKILLDQGIISEGSKAVSIGGIEDKALGMNKRGRAILQKSIDDSGIYQIVADDFADSVEKRMKFYKEQAGGAKITAYINVGGGTISVGKKVGKRLFKPGLNRRAPGPVVIDSVMARFVDTGVPVIHLVKIVDLADRYGLEVSPIITPAVGRGNVFVRVDFNRWLVAGLLIAILASLYLFVRSDIGFRMLQRPKKGGDGGHPEPMV